MCTSVLAHFILLRRKCITENGTVWYHTGNVFVVSYPGSAASKYSCVKRGSFGYFGRVPFSNPGEFGRFPFREAPYRKARLRKPSCPKQTLATVLETDVIGRRPFFGEPNALVYFTWHNKKSNTFLGWHAYIYFLYCLSQNNASTQTVNY